MKKIQCAKCGAHINQMAAADPCDHDWVPVPSDNVIEGWVEPAFRENQVSKRLGIGKGWR